MFEPMHELLRTAADKKRFTSVEKDLAISLFGEMNDLLETGQNPAGFRLATGDLATGATGRIALNCYFLLLGRLALGRYYARMDKRMEYWSLYLGFHIMRGYFNGSADKGFYCCPICTLSVLPLYCLKAFDGFDCDELRDNVVTALQKRSGRFAARFSMPYADWALKFNRS